MYTLLMSSSLGLFNIVCRYIVLLADIPYVSGSTANSKYICSNGTLACAPTSPLNRYLSIASRFSILCLLTLCHTSLLQRIPFNNQDYLNSRPTWILLEPNGRSFRNANIVQTIAYPLVILWAMVEFGLQLLFIISPRYFTSCASRTSCVVNQFYSTRRQHFNLHGQILLPKQ